MAFFVVPYSGRTLDHSHERMICRRAIENIPRTYGVRFPRSEVTKTVALDMQMRPQHGYPDVAGNMRRVVPALGCTTNACTPLLERISRAPIDRR